MASMSRFLCLALDTPMDLTQIVSFLLPFRGRVDMVKIHYNFLRYGVEIIKVILGLGFKVWVDLKFQDTPGTVAEEVAELSNMGVHFVSIHLWGGSEMIRSAVSATGNPTQHRSGMIILGVTVLTTTSQKMLNEEQRVPGTILGQVLHLTRLGWENGVKGFVCSGQEAPFLRKAHGMEIFIATPGVRLTSSDVGNHKRVVTPYQAIRNGSNLVVMGRDLISGVPATADKVLAGMLEAFIQKAS